MIFRGKHNPPLGGLPVSPLLAILEDTGVILLELVTSLIPSVFLDFNLLEQPRWPICPQPPPHPSLWLLPSPGLPSNRRSPGLQHASNYVIPFVIDV